MVRVLSYGFNPGFRFEIRVSNWVLKPRLVLKTMVRFSQ